MIRERVYSNHSAVRLATLALTAVSLMALTLVAEPQSASAQVSFEVAAKVGVASASIDNVAHGDPVFDVGGGFQAAALLRFVGGIGAGLNFNYFYDSHRMSGTDGVANPAKSMSFSSPSVGIVARYRLMEAVEAGAWLNYAFGSSKVEFTGGGKTEWDIQGFELGAQIQLAYQMKPYKTFILAGAYGFVQYNTLFIDRSSSSNPGSYSDMTTYNYGIGATVGVRFDFSI